MRIQRQPAAPFLTRHELAAGPSVRSSSMMGNQRRRRRDLEIAYSGYRDVVFSRHRADCNVSRAWQDIQKTWGPYILRKKKEFHEAWLNR